MTNSSRISFILKWFPMPNSANDVPFIGLACLHGNLDVERVTLVRDESGADLTPFRPLSCSRDGRSLILTPDYFVTYVFPLSVRRYFCRRLLGFSGMVISIKPLSIARIKYSLLKCTMSFKPSFFIISTRVISS